MTMQNFTSQNIKWLFTDIDGVWTDCCIYYSAEGEELKKFSYRDGMGVERLRKFTSIQIAIITGENSPMVARRAEKLKIDQVFLGVKNKLAVIEEFIKENNLILTEDFKSLFDSIWIRLSNIEKEILLKISQHDQPISRDEIKQSLSLSSMDIINGLQSLTRRFLLTKLESDQKLYTLSAVFREYLRIYHQ